MPATPTRPTAPRTIAVVTGTRAEFGLLLPVIRAIEKHPKLRLQTLVTGTHLVTDSIEDITAAGVPIRVRIGMQRKGETGRAADIAALGRGIAGFGKHFSTDRPDVVLLLGDRIEPFAAAAAGHLAGLHVAHLHGGDRAEGVADESLRHAISKLAHLHFPATAQSRRRLIRMGEHTQHIFNLGSPAIDDLGDVAAASDAPQLLIMQHPIGESDTQEHQWMAATLAATANHRRLVLMPNHDPGREGICRAIQAADVDAVNHLPRSRFLSLVKAAGVIVGNSSAGLIEAAALKTPAVNIGPRQAGREKPRSVIDCSYGEKNVRSAVKRALSLDLKNLRHPYGRGDSGIRIADRLATIDLDHIPLRKQNAY